jgi:NAD(P)-dependent dehydrogenase (short-subunit alcohol dehydrogenase family)
MQLEDKNAVIYGAAGSMGAAVARAVAREGAHVFLAGRTLSTLEALCEDIRRDGGTADVAIVDAMDQKSVATHCQHVVEVAGRIDISFNAISYRVVQNIPLVEMSLEDFIAPIEDACRTHFITATVAARQMQAQRSGVIILLSATSALESRHQMGGFNLACASIEALTRSLAGEIGHDGVRVVGLRPNFTPETYPGVTDKDVALNVSNTLLGRLPRLSEVAGTVVYLASDAAGAMTGAVVNLSCGAVFG